jgi:gliding motility-associated-like protein
VKKSDGTQIVNETLGDVSTYTLTTNLEENTVYEVTVFASDGTTETTGCTVTEVQTKNSITPNTNDIPNFFTPNNDGYNDTWQVTDTTNNIKHIQIFDRYGKLLKQFTTNSQGWDGNYMGNPMPNSDYWYVIIWNTGKPTKGHFSLIRR